MEFEVNEEDELESFFSKVHEEEPESFRAGVLEEESIATKTEVIEEESEPTKVELNQEEPIPTINEVIEEIPESTKVELNGDEPISTVAEVIEEKTEIIITKVNEEEPETVKAEASEQTDQEKEKLSKKEKKRKLKKKNLEVLKNIENQKNQKKNEKNDKEKKQSMQKEKLRVKILQQCKEVRTGKTDTEYTGDIEPRFMDDIKKNEKSILNSVPKKASTKLEAIFNNNKNTGTTLRKESSFRVINNGEKSLLIEKNKTHNSNFRLKDNKSIRMKNQHFRDRSKSTDRKLRNKSIERTVSAVDSKFATLQSRKSSNYKTNDVNYKRDSDYNNIPRMNTDKIVKSKATNSNVTSPKNEDIPYELDDAVEDNIENKSDISLNENVIEESYQSSKMYQRRNEGQESALRKIAKSTDKLNIAPRNGFENRNASYSSKIRGKSIQPEFVKSFNKNEVITKEEAKNKLSLQKNNFEEITEVLPKDKIIKNRNEIIEGGQGIRGDIPFVTDVETWVKRNKLEPKTKVFVISPGYGSIKNALQRRNWIENPSFLSPCFHLKFSQRSKDVKTDEQADHQITNHFSKASNITTKVGLVKTLKNCVWFCSEDPQNWFPECYDMNSEQDYEAFQSYYKVLRTEGYIKKFIQYCQDTKDLDRNSEEYNKKLTKLQVAIDINLRRLYHMGEALECSCPNDYMTAKEWSLFEEDEMTEKDLLNVIHEENMKRYTKKDKPKKKRKKKTKQKPVTLESSKQNDTCKKILNKNADQQNNEESDEETKIPDNVPQIEKNAYKVLKELQKVFPQTEMNGSNNIWIVKPASQSRGRGIKIFGSWVEINRQIKNRDCRWVVQKYIENPALIRLRKYDIRQWVLITDWNPLTIWFYDECYIRFSASDFSLNNLRNRFAHLTNNSVNKNSANYEIRDELFWTMDQLADHFHEETGYDHFNEVMKPRMKEIVKYSLMSVQEHIQNRKNSSEIYGYDFCIDEKLNLWLIEINSSPAFDFSSDVTERLVKSASEDYIKVIVDHNLSTKKKQKRGIDTGAFECIHKSKFEIVNAKEAMGMNLSVSGTNIEHKMQKKMNKFNF